MKRTGSMASRVGPAVTSTDTPDSAPSATRPSACPARSAGSSMRPAPTSPQAWSPSPGPSTQVPRSCSVRRFARVAGAAHIWRFIAGAIAIGAAVARHTVVSRSSASPAARRAITFAVAGATSTRSAQRASSMWPMPASARSSSSSVCTGLPDTAWKVSGVMNACAPRVITTRTRAPRSISRRHRSALL